MIVFCDPQNIKKHPNWAPLRAADEKLCSISNAKPQCAKTQRITQHTMLQHMHHHHHQTYISVMSFSEPGMET